MKKLGIALVFLLTVAVLNVPDSCGYTWIFGRFRQQYLPGRDDTPTPEQEDLAQGIRQAQMCFVCHDPNHPKKEDGWEEFHNPYGAALKDILGDPAALQQRYDNSKGNDEARQVLFDDIDAALEEVGGQDAGDGKSYDDIIQSGALPYELPEGFGEEN